MSNNSGLKILTLGGAALLSACSIFPYHENFACENMNDYGRCLDVKGAYEVATTGQPQGEPIKKNDNARQGKTPPEKTTAHPEQATNPGATVDPQTRAAAQRYQRMARTLKAPKTPLVKPPEVVRVLVLHYSDPHQAGAPLYGQRYIHFLGSDPEWVLGRPLPEPDDALSTWE